jgi:hypothetical protein
VSDRPPFDPVQASFYLVAGVIAVHAAVVLLGAAQCLLRAEPSTCDATGRLGDMLAGALAAALAFAGGYVRRPPDDRPPK